MGSRRETGRVGGTVELGGLLGGRGAAIIDVIMFMNFTRMFRFRSLRGLLDFNASDGHFHLPYLWILLRRARSGHEAMLTRGASFL